MAILSKIAGISLPYNCYEVGHTWHPDCNTAALILGASAFREGLKIYFPLYVITLFLRGKLSLDGCMNVLTNAFTSSAFLGFHGLGVIFFSCLLRKLLGRYYFLSYFYIPSFITSFLALLIERKNRRLPLAIYVTNVATETILRMAATRGILKPVPNAEIYLFSILMAINLYIAKKYGYSEDVVSSIFKFILGDNEARKNVKSQQEKDLSSPSSYSLLEKAVLCGMRLKEEVGTSLLQKMWSTIRHPSCPHDYSCFLYCLQGFLRPFLIGFVALSASRCLSFGKKLISDPSKLFSLLFEKRNLSLGLFLGGFGATFRIINCLLRWYFAKDHASYAIPAALLGGLFMKFYPSSTISLYLMWKTMEKGYLIGMEKGALPHIKCFTPLLYSVSTALLFHVAVLEAHNLKPAYFQFLTKVTHNRLFTVNHHALDIFGTQSSKLFPDSWPELDHRYTSRIFQECVLLWLIH
ncbi:Transmembrane protein 135 [Araneus ventricosus]|uniref:Transmembrane protein 135 n=1 Tax=Araneus ventricosus TaxID=182803 RepID=A0A4Y2CUH8_ARAVE|nr:Transmembrane protein 135 [Araneus ventricosus]